MHNHSFISSASSTSPGSSSSSQGSLSPASSLSPALSIRQGKHHHHNRRRRPSPLKRQMSLGNGGPESSPAAGQPALDIDPRRSHAAGPLAVLYSVEPHEDPLLNPSPARSPSKNSLRGSIHSSPINELSAEDPPHGTPRSVSALAALERAAPPASPNRSLLSAFQAVSPRLQNVTSRSISAPSLSHLQGYTSPRGPAPQSLAPASPISTSPRQPTARTSYATAAFRALNGASPQKQVPSRSSSSSSVPSTSAANVSPVRSRSSSALRQVFNDAPCKSSL